MKLLTLYQKNVFISYKHSFCSFATFFTLIIGIFTVVMPFVVIASINSDLWHQSKIIFEQPIITFKYKYILLAEHGKQRHFGKTENKSVLISWSSYDWYNEVMENWQGSVAIKFWEKDHNYDKVMDQLNVQFVYDAPATGAAELTYMNIYLELESSLQNYQHCQLPVPAAVILQKLSIPRNFHTGEIYISGSLQLQQKAAFLCPFFGRKVKSHFNHQLISENSTTIEDYEFKSIAMNLANNVGFLIFKQHHFHWKQNVATTGSKQISVNIQIDLGEVESRYETSFWQKCSQIWIQYLSIVCVFVYLLDKLKSYMFSTQRVCAWEIVPWKKLH